MDCSPPGSSVHGVSQARILQWVALSSSRGSSWPRDWTHISWDSWLAGRFFTTVLLGKPPWRVVAHQQLSFQLLKLCSWSPGMQAPCPSGQVIKWHSLCGSCVPAGFSEAAGECGCQGTPTGISKAVGRCLDGLHRPASAMNRVSALAVCAHRL